MNETVKRIEQDRKSSTRMPYHTAKNKSGFQPLLAMANLISGGRVTHAISKKANPSVDFLASRHQPRSTRQR
jgi:hypothetical protein